MNAERVTEDGRSFSCRLNLYGCLGLFALREWKESFSSRKSFPREVVKGSLFLAVLMRSALRLNVGFGWA